MGYEAIYICNSCGNEFKTRYGGGESFKEYRCQDCDKIKTVHLKKKPDKDEYTDPTPEEIGACGWCQGELREDINPMCWECRSRDTEVKEILIYYD